MKRQVVGLKWARELDEKPNCIPNSKPKGNKALGIRYEKSFHKYYPWANRGVWYEFEDKFGWGCCQVDFIIRNALQIVVIESKLTWNEAAHVELEKLYIPVVQAASKFTPTFGLVMCKNLTKNTRGVEISGDLSVAVRNSYNKRSVFHWLGNSGVMNYGKIDYESAQFSAQF